MAGVKNRRHYYRHPIEVPIQVTELNQNRASQRYSRDISEGGICFFTPDSLAQGVSVEVAIPIVDQLFKLQAKVAYSRKNAKTGLFQTGISFQNKVSLFRAKLAEEILSLRKYCEHLIRSSGHEISIQEAEKRWMRENADRFAAIFSR